MIENLKDQKLRSQPVQLIETDEGIILKRGCTQLQINGRGAAEGVRLVLSATTEQASSLEEICSHTAPKFHPSLEQLVQFLVAKRLLEPINGSEGSNDFQESLLDIFYWHFGESTEKITIRLNHQPFIIFGVNHISRQLSLSLAESGVENLLVVDDPFLRNQRLFADTRQVMLEQWPKNLPPPIALATWHESADSTSPSCFIGTSDFGGIEEMRKWNRFCIEHKQHFLPIVLKDLIGYVGPLVVPEETACYECLLSRQMSNMENPEVESAIDGAAFQGQNVIGYHPSMASLLGNLAAFELTKAYGEVLPNRNFGKLIVIKLLATHMSTHKVLKIPRCMVCSPLLSRPSSYLQNDHATSDIPTDP